MCMVVRLTLLTKTKNTQMNETVAMSSKCYNIQTQIVQVTEQEKRLEK